MTPFALSPRMRCLIVGCGSIGSRRARLLAEMGHEVLLYDEDDDRASRAAGAVLTATGQNPVVLNSGGWLQLAILKPAVFICTPAETHFDVAMTCLDADVTAVFIEKPLSVNMYGIDELRRAALGRTVMVACNLRFAYGHGRTFPRATDGHLRLVQHKPLSQWRPGAEAYRRNGIVLEAAIHEIDLAYAWQGPITTMAASGHEDHVVLTLEHQGDATSSRRHTSHIDVRWAEHVEPQRFAECGGTAYTPDLTDEMYRLEMEHFLDCVRTRRRVCNTIDDAAHVLGWALKAREAVTV